MPRDGRCRCGAPGRRAPRSGRFGSRLSGAVRRTFMATDPKARVAQGVRQQRVGLDRKFPKAVIDRHERRGDPEQPVRERAGRSSNPYSQCHAEASQPQHGHLRIKTLTSRCGWVWGRDRPPGSLQRARKTPGPAETGETDEPPSATSEQQRIDSRPQICSTTEQDEVQYRRKGMNPGSALTQAD